MPRVGGDSTAGRRTGQHAPVRPTRRPEPQVPYAQTQAPLHAATQTHEVSPLYNKHLQYFCMFSVNRTVCNKIHICFTLFLNSSVWLIVNIVRKKQRTNFEWC